MAMTIEDSFRGDDAKLISCIEALIHLNDAGALVPHGIGGHARELLSAAAVRLNTHLTQPAQAVDVGAVNGVIVDLEERARNGGDAFPDEFESWAETLTRALAGEKAEGWRPIETAPRDGTPVILGYANSHSCEGFWMGNPERNHWGETGWFDSDSDVLCEHAHHPDAWMPLPTPPTDGEE
jgi:hypothetical protein